MPTALLLLGCLEYGVTSTSDVQGTVPAATGASTGTPPAEDTPPTDVATTPGIATAPVYANTTDTLYEVDPATGERFEIGVFHRDAQVVENMVDIAIDLDGRMVGGTFDTLYRIDPDTAALTWLCDADFSMYALAFTSRGELFAGGEGTILRVDPDTCATTPLVPDVAYVTSGDLVGLPDGYLYWTVRGDDGDELVRVDPSTGATRWLGPTGYHQLYGLGYDEGLLYGFSAEGPIVVIDPADARATLVADPGEAWWGATTNPVVW